jgi:RNase H-fold protein (predicted Holliday junction resolvase)
MNPILALDFGRVRIGAAISDELQLLAHPLETIPANGHAPSRVAEIVREKNVDHVVAGIPRQMNGQIGAAAAEVLQFVEKLRAILPHSVLRRSSSSPNDFAKLSRPPRRGGAHQEWPVIRDSVIRNCTDHRSLITDHRC